MAKTAAKALAPVVVDVAYSFVKSQIAGSGRKRGPGRPKSTTAKKPKAKKPKAKKAPAKKRATKKGTALRPAGD